MTMIDSTAGARTARPADREGLNRALSAAFLDDPVFRWLIPEEAERLRLLPRLFDTMADAFARHDATRVVSAGDDGAVGGAALWAPPGVAPVSPEDEAVIAERLATEALPYLDKFAALMEVFEAAHPEEPAWFLQFLGVDPALQGRGLGSRLLHDVLDVADRNGEAAYLEATSERNRALYERHGFRWVGDLLLPGGPVAYAMWRDPVT